MRSVDERSVRWIAALPLVLLAACIQVVQTAPPDEPPPRTPDPFTSLEEPTLEATDLPGLFKAPSLDANCYYFEPDRAWYRFAYNRWYQAFRWDGAWFQLRPQDVPKMLVGRVSIKPAKSKKKRLRELERRLEEIERQERLEEQQRRLEEIDRQENQERQDGQEGSEDSPPAPDDASPGAP